MSAVSIRRYDNLCGALIATEITAKILISLGSKPVYVYGNILCLMLLAIIPLILSRGINFILSIMVMGMVFNILIDTKFAIPYEAGINDIIAWSIIFLTGMAMQITTKPAIEFDRNSLILLAILLIKPITQHSLIPEVYYIGDATTHFLFAAFAYLNIKDTPKIVAELLFIFTLNHLYDNLLGDPYQISGLEIAFCSYFLLRAVWVYLRRKYKTNVNVYRLLYHIAVAFHFLLLGLLFITYRDSIITWLRYTLFR